MDEPTVNRNPLNVVVYTKSLPRKCTFVCKDAADHPELTAEFPPVTVTELFSHPIRRRTRGVQAGGGSRNGSSQTTFNYPRHATSQYEARQFNQQEIEHHLSSTNFQTFLSKASLRVERVLVENCLFNPFNDHVSRLRCVDEALDPLDSFRRVPVGNIKCSDRVPRRLMHHGDLCEGKFVSSVHCHPTFPGIVAAGYITKVQLEHRQNFRDSTRNTGRHFAIVWKTSHLLEPTIILEAPDDILAIRFNPHQPYVLAASCQSGMIVVWDTSAQAALIKGIKNKAAVRPKEPPVIVPAAATLENYPCTSRRLEWAPNSVEFSAKGPIGITANRNICQIYTAYDAFMTVWDARLLDDNVTIIDPTLPRLPNRVRPVFKVYPIVKDKRREVAITCFAMVDHCEKKTNYKLSDMAVYPPVCIAGTDEGEIFIIDWRNYTEMERGAACNANLCVAFHDGPVVDVIAAPHISNAVLSVGGRIWAIWKSVDLEGPVLELPPRPAIIQSAAWSPWQSSILAIGLADGLVEIWDILLSTAKPQKKIRISQSAITAIGFGRDEEGTYIAISDADGTGKITLVPFYTKTLCPGVRELTKVENFIDNEVRHRLSMAQMAQEAAAPAAAEIPEIPFVYTDQKSYLEDFRALEQRILQDVNKTTEGETARTARTTNR